MGSRQAEPFTPTRHDTISSPPAPSTHQRVRTQEQQANQQHPPPHFENIHQRGRTPTTQTRMVQPRSYSTYSPPLHRPTRPTQRYSYTMLHPADQTRHGRNQARIAQRRAAARQQRTQHTLNQLADLLESTPALEIELSMIYRHGIEAYERMGLGMGLAWFAARFQWEVEEMWEDDRRGLWFGAEGKVEWIEEELIERGRGGPEFSFYDWWDAFVVLR